ncbi:MAG: succinylglutamate-semialdehyde dehydrogenase [Phycisphaerales bacterium]
MTSASSQSVSKPAHSSTLHASLREPSADYINGRFVPAAGAALTSHNPADPREIVFCGATDITHVDAAVAAAREALPAWARLTIDDRADVLRRWQSVVRANIDRIATLITDEMGKTIAESRLEAGALAAKVDITLGTHSMARVQEYTVSVSDSRAGNCRYKPHGVMAVIGPYNFPAHLPNGHFVPALLMGNTVIFKPSEKTPAVGQLLAELMHEAEVPHGVFNMIQGAADVAPTLVAHDDIDGILFTGSWPVGRKILEANLDRPGRMIALEMGGNNPAVVMPSASLQLAVVECVRAAFATSGQRCTCTRRILLHRDIADRFIRAFAHATSVLMIGPGHAQTPTFMGPLVTEASADAVVKFQRELIKRGGNVLVQATRMDRPGWFVSPGVVQVERFSLEHDCEVFGPLVQIAVVDSLDDAITQANATRYGLAASIFTEDDAEYERFFAEVHAGCINRNTGTAGASSELPFGGVGLSGNHRPAGAFSAEYCAYPVANMVERNATAMPTLPAGMTWRDEWLK